MMHPIAKSNVTTQARERIAEAGRVKFFISGEEWRRLAESSEESTKQSHGVCASEAMDIGNLK